MIAEMKNVDSDSSESISSDSVDTRQSRKIKSARHGKYRSLNPHDATTTNDEDDGSAHGSDTDGSYTTFATRKPAKQTNFDGPCNEICGNNVLKCNMW